jgi:hypothetical protein
VHLLDDLEAPLDQDRGEAHRRLVHQEQLRPRHERAAHRDHLLLAARERPCELLAALVQAREQAVYAVEVLAEVGAAAQVRAQLEVLAHTERSEEPAVLRHDRDAPLDPVRRRDAGHVLALDRHGAAPRADDAEDRLQRRRLA